MEWQVILALVIVIPVILIPVLFVWYLNMGGIYAVIRARLAAREKRTKEPEAEQAMAVAVKEQSMQK